MHGSVRACMLEYNASLIYSGSYYVYMIICANRRLTFITDVLLSIYRHILIQRKVDWIRSIMLCSYDHVCEVTIYSNISVPRMYIRSSHAC